MQQAVALSLAHEATEDLPILSRHEVSVNTVLDLVRLNLGILCDVRQPWEQQTESRFLGSLTLPLLSLRAFMHQPLTPEEQEEAPHEEVLATMPKVLERFNHARDQAQFVICFCRSGRRSLEAVQLLRELGYRNTLSLQGGVEAWEAAGLPAL